jgi:NAD(P)-dependent dehydrogenase (short-subunit alcohol dehydrogenase family)
VQIADDRVVPITLDVTKSSQIQQASDEFESLDILINNAGIAIYDDLSNIDVIEKHFAVNFLGPLRMTQAFLPLLKRSKAAIVNNLSLVGLAALPLIPSYSISKAAAFNMKINRTISEQSCIIARAWIQDRGEKLTGSKIDKRSRFKR